MKNRKLQIVSLFIIYFSFFVALLPARVRIRATKSQVILEREINYILNRSNTPRTIKGIEIYSRKNKKVLFQTNSGLLLNPASNLKIVTTSFALQNLGSNFKFKTRLIATGPRNGNAIEGDLLVAACGDPIISHADLDSIAKIVSQSGIRIFGGNLVIDVSRFDSLGWGSGWMWDDEPGDYQMFITPACLDHNTITVQVSLDSITRKLAVTTQPATSFIRVVSTATADTLDSLFVTRVMTDDMNTISVSGKYSQNLRPSEYDFSVRNPAQYFGTVFREILGTHGIDFRGKILIESEPVIHEIGPDADTIFTFVDSMDTVITYINKVSDNLGAECLLREVPNEIYGQTGSAANGIKLERGFLSQCGVDSTEYYIVDGSGLSHYDLITPDAILKVLNYDLNQPYGSLFMYSLPVAGNDGTLDKRMDQKFIIGNVFAKTGSISGVSTLSGYVTLPKDTLVFSMMMQNFITNSDSIRALQDSLCTVLSLYNDNSSTFKKNLRKYDVGTYWAINQKRIHRLEMYRNRMKERDSVKLRKKPANGR